MSGRPTPGVLIVGTKFSYPEGFGATTRTRAYARGLLDAGANVHVVSLLGPVRPPVRVNPLAQGVDEGVPYEYACGTRVRPDSFLERRWLQAKMPVNVWRAARRLFARSIGPRTFLVYSDQPHWVAFIALLAKAMRAACVVEICEIPFINEQGAFVPAKRLVQDSVAYRLVDGFIVISTYLQEYVARHAPRGKRVIRVPILVIGSDFPPEVPALPGGSARYVVYTGYLGNSGEVPDLLDSFASIASEYPDLALSVAGDAAPPVVADLARRIDELGLTGRIELAGGVGRRDLPALLRSATMLVLPRRAALFSQAGFPTKLGEYLASGRPVVVTATGDIPRYLTTAVNAYLAAPGDPAVFAAQMRRVLDDEAEATAVGRRGRALALRCFDYRRHGARLLTFFDEVRR